MPTSMIILCLFLLCGVLLSVWHSYQKRGGRLTFTFFFFAFLYILRWVLKNLVSPSPLLKTAKQLNLGGLLENSNSAASAIQMFFLGTIILLEWLLLFYLGWFVAEKIVERFSFLQKRLFPILLLSSLITVSFLYPIEAIGHNLSWWRWQPFIQTSYDVFFVDCPLHSLRSGFYFVLYFLAAYFLIECSKFKYKGYKMAFFILPFMHLWIIRFFGNGLPRLIEYVVIFSILIVLTFLSTLKLEDLKPDNPLKLKIADKMFLGLIITILFILFVIIIFMNNKLVLVFTLLPALFFLLLSSKNIIPGLIFIFCIPALFLGKIVAISSFVPIFVFFIFKICDYSERDRKKWI